MIRTAISRPIPVLNPIFEIQQCEVIMSISQIVGIDFRILGRKICTLKQERDKIIAALDLMFTGY